MPGSPKNVRVKDIRDLLKSDGVNDLFLVIGNKPRAHYCALLLRKTGAIVHFAKSNWAMVEMITAPGFKYNTDGIVKTRGLGVTIDTAQFNYDLNTQADNAAENVQRWLKTFMELMDSDTLPNIILKDDVIKLFVNGIQYPIKQSKRK